MLSLNRMAIVVMAKRPFLDWLHAVDPTSFGLTLDDLNHEPNVYLLPEAGSDDEAVRQVGRFCPHIVEEELDGWWRERSDWPAKLDFALFDEWFEWRCHSMVLDLGKVPLVREQV
ncbi:MAG TPA: hypothetical protein VMB03_21110 [Bryobacteraceae bacterium]|nr:hypothetical protein [Bryobacteraceae bacterium]